MSLVDPAQQISVPARAVVAARAGDTRKALGLALRARDEARALQNDAAEGEAMNAAAIVHLTRGDPVSAVAAGIDACHLARRLANPSLEGHARVSLCSAAHTLGAAIDARRALEACIRQAVGAGDPELQVRARVVLGIVLSDQGHFDKAREQYGEALVHVGAGTISTSEARITTNIANLHRKRAVAYLAAGDADGVKAQCAAAIATCERALVLATREDSLPTRIDALAIGGCVHALARRPDDALRLLGEAADMGRQAHLRATILWVLCELGRLLAEAGELDTARAAFAEALDIAIELRPSTKARVACEGLASVERTAGNVFVAEQWNDRARRERIELELSRVQTRRQLESFFN